MSQQRSNGTSNQQHRSPEPSSREVIESLKAKADAKRTSFEKIADFLTETFGTTWFLIANLIWFIVWIGINSGIMPGFEPFDPFPFSFLTMVVSLEAIALAIIVLISQNRGAKVADLREETDLQVDMIAEKEMTKLLELVCKLAEKNGIDVSHDHELKEMLHPTNTEDIEQVLEAQVLKKS